MKYQIEIDRTRCIACGTCYTLNPSHFEPDNQEKSTVIGGKTDENESVGTFEDTDIENAQTAQDSCPVSAINVTKL
ncbi:MAG: ferredoxin [Candidatus Bathyarchaeia archaeon]|jgi:ferredoxin